MYKLLLIFKYLRRKLVPLLAAAAVALCTVMVIVVISIMGGFLEQWRTSAKKLTGDVIIRAPSTIGFPHYQALMNALLDQSEIVAVTPMIETFGLVKLQGWLSYESDGEVYVQPYPVGSGQPRRVTEGGGDLPVWSRNGRELFYENDGQLWAVEITTEPTADWEDPVALFETPWLTPGNGIVNYDVTPDGQRFVFVQPLETAIELRQINVVLNWFQELTERVPVN